MPYCLWGLAAAQRRDKKKLLFSFLLLGGCLGGVGLKEESLGRRGQQWCIGPLFPQMRCCGVTDYTDWYPVLGENIVPDRCCMENSQGCGRNTTTPLWRTVRLGSCAWGSLIPEACVLGGPGLQEGWELVHCGMGRGVRWSEASGCVCVCVGGCMYVCIHARMRMCAGTTVGSQKGRELDGLRLCSWDLQVEPGGWRLILGVGAGRGLRGSKVMELRAQTGTRAKKNVGPGRWELRRVPGPY